MSQKFPTHIRKDVVFNARKNLARGKINPYDSKLMGFITEVKSLDIVPACFLCGNKYLHYSFLDYPLGDSEKSWRDIECLKCEKFIVEVKSTRRIAPKNFCGGSYKAFQRMEIKPYLLIFSNLRVDSNGKYHNDKPIMCSPGYYNVFPRSNGKSYIKLP